jgi:hypothetical protein
MEVLEKIQKILGDTVTQDKIRETYNGYIVDWFYLSYKEGRKFKAVMQAGSVSDAINIAKDLNQKHNCKVEIVLYKDTFDKQGRNTYSKKTDYMVLDRNTITFDFMNTTFVNLTPHDVNIVDNDGNVILIVPACDKPLRLIEKRDSVGDINGIPLSRVSYEIDSATPLPNADTDTFYIVSRIVAEMFKRNDFIVPDQTVRNDKGQIIGCKGFAFV